ncbi:hypothetical protein [Geomicrobium sp. JCM 19055]|uniref:hypothetical protein n=1 Tax=Geomicrobium sp. JCM 19055 TaxID=1460649 RepID=UPI00045ED793|nr:hypothetical protein [Geomicrobium sp. JCM 19055]GAK00085.1 hypothetical protein JCM19055_3154 [Geomicrobium sp. JCM 19055]
MIGSIISIDDVDAVQRKELYIRKEINQKPLQSQYTFEDILGNSEGMENVKKRCCEICNHANFYFN